MLVEPFANDRVEDNISPVGRLYYAASTTICCAHAISEGGRMVLGAQAGEARLAEVFRKAGFTRFRRADGDAVQPDPRGAPLAHGKAPPAARRSGWRRVPQPAVPGGARREGRA